MGSQLQYRTALPALPGISLTVLLDETLIETGLLTTIENKGVYVGMAQTDWRYRDPWEKVTQKNENRIS